MSIRAECSPETKNKRCSWTCDGYNRGTVAVVGSDGRVWDSWFCGCEGYAVLDTRPRAGPHVCAFCDRDKTQAQGALLRWKAVA